MLQRLGGTRIAGSPLETAVEEVRNLSAELVERAEEAGVELVVLLEQLLDDTFPDLTGENLGVFLAW